MVLGIALFTPWRGPVFCWWPHPFPRTSSAVPPTGLASASGSDHAEIIFPGGAVRASAGHTAITPRLTSLLSGKNEMAAIHVKNFHVRLRIAEKEKTTEVSPSRATSTVIPAFPALDIPDMTVRIEKGILDVFQEDVYLLSFRDIQGDTVSEPQRGGSTSPVALLKPRMSWPESERLQSEKETCRLAWGRAINRFIWTWILMRILASCLRFWKN
jgi:hypothetical protein